MDLIKELGLDQDPTFQLRSDLFEDSRQAMNKLVEIRKARKMTLKDVAEKMGSDPASIFRFESGERDPHLSTIRRYATAIGARIETTVTRADDPGRKRHERNEILYSRQGVGSPPFSVDDLLRELSNKTRHGAHQ